MNTTPSPVPSQERFAGLLGSIFFFVPMFMDKVTEYTMVFMRQNFLIFITLFIAWICAAFIPHFWIVYTPLSFLSLALIAFLAWKAWQWDRFTVPYLYEWSNRLIQVLMLESLFSPKK